MSEGIALRVHPAFFKEFASKTWTSVYGVVAELVENSYDEDATKVVLTILDDSSIAVEDDAGMSETTLKKFLLVGSPHKQEEQRSPIFKRLRSGKYGTGRLGFLTAFKRMMVKTRRGEFSLGSELNESLLENLASGTAELNIIREPPLNREGTEIRLVEPKVKVDPSRLIRELRRLPCLKQPFFELYIKQTTELTEWSLEGAERIQPPQVEGIRIPVTGQGLDGEVIVSKRPLSNEERGLAVMVGGHAVARSSFGISNVIGDRITGYVRGEGLTARFADKSALVEDDVYEDFSRKVKVFLRERVIPSIEGYIEVEITREESRVYRQVDQLLATAVHHVIESVVEEKADHTPRETMITHLIQDKAEFKAPLTSSFQTSAKEDLVQYQDQDSAINQSAVRAANEASQEVAKETSSMEDVSAFRGTADREYEYRKMTQVNISRTPTSIQQSGFKGPVRTESVLEDLRQPKGRPFTVRDVRPQQVRKSFILKRVGYRVIPYEDEYDEKEAFAEESVIYVNKAHPAYRVEAQKGSELLLRHVVRLVSKVIALSHHPEGREALELQNKLIAEAVRLREQKREVG